jgi:chromate transporter
MAKISLIELAKTFLKIGILSFGGPYAHISLFEDELINNKPESNVPISLPAAFAM